MTPTDTVGISVSRLASTRPAVPPPAMRKSKFVEANASGVVIEVIFRVEDLKSRADLQNKREDGRREAPRKRRTLLEVNHVHLAEALTGLAVRRSVGNLQLKSLSTLESSETHDALQTNCSILLVAGSKTIRRPKQAFGLLFTAQATLEVRGVNAGPRQLPEGLL